MKKYLLEIGEAGNVGYDTEKLIYDTIEEANEAYDAAVQMHIEEVEITNNMNDEDKKKYEEEVEETDGGCAEGIAYKCDPDGEWYVMLDVVVTNK